MAKVEEDAPRRVVVRAPFEEGVVAELDAIARATKTSRSEVLRRQVTQALADAGGEDEDWEHHGLQALLGEYGPEDEGLYDDPEAIGATRVEW
jgi:predicted transcriptional regulator